VNERIKLLAEQAGMIIVDDQFSTYGKFAEKFAELIVRECIDYCGENLSKTVGGALKIHFGVES
jgi:hypothetical protein